MANAKQLKDYLLRLEQEGNNLEEISLIAWSEELGDNTSIDSFELDASNGEELIFNI
jgi:hypothetical protein